MRAFVLAAALAAAATPALAQPAVLNKFHKVHGTLPDPLADLSGAGRRWIQTESERQFKSPTSLYDLELSMLRTLEPDLQRLARHEHLSFDEVSVMVMHEVITDVASDLDRAVHRRQDELEKAGTPLSDDERMQDLLRRKEALRAQIAELGPRMTLNNRMLAAGK